MKILFAADMSFNYMPETATRERAAAALAESAECFRDADFSVVNLENVLGKKADYEPIVKDGPNLISTDSYIEYVNALRPSAVGLANNHSGDFGDGALFHTIDLLKGEGYQVFGAGRNLDEAYRPAVFEKDGVRVSVIGVNENEFGIAKRDCAGSAGYAFGRVFRAVRAAEAAGTLPVVYFHGGNEHNPLPSPGKKALYRSFIDIGAKAVIAMHTHCPQGWEMYEDCPIVYSMGNFFFPENGDVLPSWSVGYMAELTLNADGASLRTIPYAFDMDGQRLLSGEEKRAFDAYLAHISEMIADDALLQEYFDAWCMMRGRDGYMGKMFCLERGAFLGSAEAVKGVKNIFGCEAHNELLTNALQVIYERRAEAAEEKIPEIQKLQRMQF